eukprot:CAMPEP_0202979314 /NCGR_PEP_ID=MMETSP1396-20130829/85502_1 /ASSEMBLY_ACC=CAM_ASM_000872 /TAXON_ID= /ORGANISM="Pseudokeronopsis sp., Strain Brazil" /LENGTH=88 /DNA_ID=CAMNT_0049718693 /DNA_START=2434 /DNA_END=2700 /DNA_ORIENTATION=-
MQSLLGCSYLHDILMLLSETMQHVNQKETNNEIILFFSTLISARNSQQVVFRYLDLVTVALLAAISKEQGSNLEKISHAMVILLNTAE